MKSATSLRARRCVRIGAFVSATRQIRDPSFNTTMVVYGLWVRVTKCIVNLADRLP